MPWKTVAVFVLLGLIAGMTPTASIAQEAGPIQTFKLLRNSDTAAEELDLEAEETESWVRQLSSHDIELSMALGFLDLGTTLLSHEQIIYKYTTEYTYWGDVDLNGQNAFAPQLRLGYSLTKWLTLESIGSISFSEYKASITNRNRRKNEPGSAVEENPALGEFDAEHRSLITLSFGGNAVFYPMGLIREEGRGLLQPYLTGGYSRMWYDMNSQYSDGMVSTNDYNIGAGLRIVGDDRVSIRLEVTYHKNTVEFDAPQYFQILDEGTTLIPLEEHPIVDGVRIDRQIETYKSQDISALGWSIGIQGSF